MPLSAGSSGMHPLVEHLYWEKLSPVQGGIVFAEGFRWKFVLAANDRAAPTRQFAGLRPCCATPSPQGICSRITWIALCRCHRTVRRAMPSARAISSSVLPSSIPRTTRRCLSVRTRSAMSTVRWRSRAMSPPSSVCGYSSPRMSTSFLRRITSRRTCVLQWLRATFRVIPVSQRRGSRTHPSTFGFRQAISSAATDACWTMSSAACGSST